MMLSFPFHTSKNRRLLLTAMLSLTMPAFLCSMADAKPKFPAEGYRLQPADDYSLPLKPLQPRPPEQDKKVDALAWYLTGQIRQSRNDFIGALEAFQKAVQLDPHAVAIYRELVPLTLSLHRTDQAIQYALKAVELDPDNHQFLRLLGRHMAVNQKIDEAIKYLQQAADSANIQKESATYLALMRDLALLYSAKQDKQKTADCYEIIFDALQNPKKFNLNEKMHQALMQDRNTSYERIGVALLDAERYDKAVDAFEKASQSEKAGGGALHYNLATVYLKTEQKKKALEEIQKYLDAQLRSKGRDAYQLYADILIALDRKNELLPKLKTLVEKDPRNSTLLYFLAEQYAQNDQLDNAEKLYKKTLDELGDSKGYLGLAGVYRKQGKAKALLETLSKAIQSGPSLTMLEAELEAISQDDALMEKLIAAGRKQAMDKDSPLDFPTSYILAKLASNNKQTDAAMEFFRHAIKTRPDRAALLYEELGSYLMQQDAYTLAAEIYREATGHPNLGAQKHLFLFRLSQALELNHETDEAVKAIQEARSIDTTNAEFHFWEGWIYSHSKRWQDAIRVFEEVINEHAQNKQVVRRTQYSLSNVYVQKGDMRKGEEILEKIFEEDPDDPSVNNDLGYLYADQNKKLNQAEQMIRKAVKAEPENAAYLDSLGWVLYRLGKYEEALENLKKSSAKLDDPDATILDHLGDCYHSLNQNDKAREHWQKALEHAKKEHKPDKKVINTIKQKLDKIKSN